jgi:hypothetical protein
MIDPPFAGFGSAQKGKRYYSGLNIDKIAAQRGYNWKYNSGWAVMQYLREP